MDDKTFFDPTDDRILVIKKDRVEFYGTFPQKMFKSGIPALVQQIRDELRKLDAEVS